MCVLVYICVGGTRVCMHVWHVCMGTRVSVLCVFWFPFLSVCFIACFNISDPFGEIPRRFRVVLLWTQYQVIRGPIHEMIQRFIPVRMVKTRRRFGSKTVSFHVSGFFILISTLYLIVSWKYLYFSALYCSWPCLFRWYLY